MNIKVSIIGAGNVATHLGQRFFDCKISLVNVFSRDYSKAQQLAKRVEATPVYQLSDLSDEADIFIIAVKDDAIRSVAEQILFQNKLVVHTSGATPSTVFEKAFERYGIFYPLQTFSVGQPVDFETLPICVDANSIEDLKLLEDLGKIICPNIYKIDDKERAILHVCAVMVNNFTNHLYSIANDVLDRENISMNILKPLIQETVNKIQSNSPKEMQTGPAIRKDSQTIKKHLDFLEKYPNYQMMYRMMSESIQEF
jgi:predicted short-subunit dehydrogenase-like oxidoreductase (DUF2520 family)